MKKLLVLIMALALVFTLASCGKDKTDDEETKAPAQTEGTTEGTTEKNEETSADTEMDSATAGDSVTVSILTSAWNSYADDEKFPAMGGDYEVMADGVPGAYSIADAEALDSALGFPADHIGDIDEAASLQHMMNANTFTGAAYRMVEGTDAAELAEAIKSNIMNRQWMCGFPETLVIIEADGCLITAFGNGEIIETFKTKVMGANEGSELLVEDAIA